MDELENVEVIIGGIMNACVRTDCFEEISFIFERFDVNVESTWVRRADSFSFSVSLSCTCVIS